MSCRWEGCLILTPLILVREGGLSKRGGEVGANVHTWKRNWNIRAHDSLVNGTFRRFSGIAKEERGGGTRRENAPSRRKSFRLDDTAASSNGRKRGDDIVRCFQEISSHLVVKGNRRGCLVRALYAATVSLRIYSAMQLDNFLVLPRATSRFWLFFWSSDDDLMKIEEQKGPKVDFLIDDDWWLQPRYTRMIGERISLRLLVSTVSITTNLEV